MELLERI